ncbi:unnamed protein product [Ixodes persulcatus]
MTSQFRNEAWLDLQEVHSSLNYLKEKLDKTGRKIDATSSSGPIQFNFPGLPTCSTDVYNEDRRAAACFDAAALSTGDKRHRGNLQNAKRRDFHSGESPKRRGSCDGQRTFVKPVCINKEMLSWDAFHRLPSRHDHFASASSAFALGDDKDRFQVSSSLRPSGHVRYRAGERVPNDGALPGYENGTSSGAMDKLRRVIERQRRAAERRTLRKVHAPLECDPVQRDSSRPRPRLDVPAAVPPPRSEHVDSEHVAIPLKIPENLVTAVPRKIHHAAPMIFPSAAADLPMPQVEEDASEHRLRSAVPDEDYVDDYLEFLRMRIEEKETESAEKLSRIVAAVPRSVADAPRVLADVPRFFADASRVAGDGWSLEEARCIDQEADGRVEQLVWKRKVVNMPPPKEYRGFSLVGGSPRARKKKQQQRAVAPKQSAPVVASSNPAVDAKSTAGAPLEKDLARPAKKSAITPTSWKEGRDLALKKHGPVPSNADSKSSQHQSSKPLEDDVDSSEGEASHLQGPSSEQNHATEPPGTMSGLSARARAQSVKRKAQLQAEAAERPSPAPKVRHYDAPAVREFIAKQRRSRQDDRRREQLGTEQVVRAKEERLEKLYALQRRTARVSAQRGRQRSRQQQEERAFVEQFAERLKSIPVRNGAASQPWCEADDDALNDDDSSPSDIASSNVGDAAVRANSSTKSPPRRDQEVQVSRQCSVEKNDRQPVEKPDSRPVIGVSSDHESGSSSELFTLFVIDRSLAMPKGCSVPKCPNYSLCIPLVKKKQLQFHRLPLDEPRRSTWCRLIGLRDAGLRSFVYARNILTPSVITQCSPRMQAGSKSLPPETRYDSNASATVAPRTGESRQASKNHGESRREHKTNFTMWRITSAISVDNSTVNEQGALIAADANEQHYARKTSPESFLVKYKAPAKQTDITFYLLSSLCPRKPKHRCIKGVPRSTTEQKVAGSTPAEGQEQKVFSEEYNTSADSGTSNAISWSRGESWVLVPLVSPVFILSCRFNVKTQDRNEEEEKIGWPQKELLEERQQELQGRRKNVQELLDWQKRLNAEEASVRALERRALARLRARAAKAPQGKTESVSVTPPPSNPPDTTSKQSDEGKGSETVDAASTEEDIAEETAATAPVTVTDSVPEEEMDEQTSGDQQGTSTIESRVVASGSSFEAEVQTETATKRSSSSRRSSPRSHDRPSSRAMSSGRTAAALLLKRPLVPRMRGPKDSGSGSEDSFNVSLSETASDQSDIEVRILALSEELKKRQLEAVQLRKEQRRRRTEFLREKEESLKRHIEVYDTLIQQAKEELEKELDLAQHDKSVCVKPQIKKPRAAEQRKHRIPQLSPDSSLPAPPLVPQAKSSKPKTESPQETSSNSSSTKAVSKGEVPTEVPSSEIIDAASSIEERSHDDAASAIEDDSKAAVSEEISERVSEEIQEASFQEEESLRGQATDASTSSAQGTSTKTLSAKERGVSVRSEKSEDVSEDTGSEGVPSSANKTDASSSHRTEPPLSAKDLNESSVEDTPKSSLDAIEEDVRSSTAAHESSIKDVEASMIAAENTIVPVTTPEAEAEAQEDDFDAVESFAEYSEEIVRSTFLDDSSKRVVEDDADQDEQVEMAVESIWSCLLDDTAYVFREALLGAKVSHEAQRSEVIRKEGDGENASRHFSSSTEKTENEGKVSLGDFDEEKGVFVSQCSEDGGATAGAKTETVKQGDQWDGSELNSIAEKLVSDAIRCVLAVAREKGMLASGEVARVSDVSRKVSVILASIEEKRNSREMRKPQDHMVLATDLDEDEVAWKDAPTVFLALDKESPPEKSGKELCSRAVQAEDCFLSTTSEQDWFDDDFGLGSGDQVFAYQRCIPNKPPPPYSPPKGGLASRMPQEPPWSVPRTEADIAAVVRKAAAVVYEAAAVGVDVEALRWDAGDLDEDVPASGVSPESGVEAESRRCYAEFLFDLTKELAQDMFCIGPSEVFPPWQRGVRLRRRRPLPASRDDFVAALEKRVLSERGFGRGDTGTSKWDASRGANFVDALLHREVCEEEPEWVDYSREEVAVKDQVADAIFLLLVDDTLEELKSLWNGAR